MSIWPLHDPEADDEDIRLPWPEYPEPEPAEACEYAAGAAEDRWIAERDRTASQ